MSKQEDKNNVSNSSEEYDSDDRECLNVIRREDEYELENDDALSDIEYNEINGDDDDSTSTSERVRT